MRQGKTLHFTYTDAKGKASDRHAEPYEIKEGKVYTWDRGREAQRQYFVDHISDVMIGEAFTPRWPIKMPDMPV